MTSMSLFMRGSVVALMVGSVLTGINQYEHLSELGAMNWNKAALTYCTLFIFYLSAKWAVQRGYFGFANGTSSRLEQCVNETRILSELGATVRDNAQRVNKASNERLEVARDTIESTDQVIACGIQIDKLSKQNLRQVGELTGQTDRVLEDMNELSSNLRESIAWATDLSGKISLFDDNFASIYQMAATIRQLADQTKLLSINASVEAARAGDAGRSFAVVATEVKNLSEASESQTDEISSTLKKLKLNVEEIQNDTRHFTQKLDTTLEGVSRGEDGSRQLKVQMNNILSEVSQSIDKVSDQTDRLRQQMSTTSEGMQTLVEGTKAVVTGSSKNIQIGVQITEHAEKLNVLALGR